MTWVVGGGVVAIGTAVFEEDAGDDTPTVLSGEDSLPWGVEAGVVVVIVEGVSEARFLAALILTFTVDGILSMTFDFCLSKFK